MGKLQRRITYVISLLVILSNTLLHFFSESYDSDITEKWEEALAFTGICLAILWTLSSLIAVMVFCGKKMSRLQRGITYVISLIYVLYTNRVFVFLNDSILGILVYIIIVLIPLLIVWLLSFLIGRLLNRTELR